MLQRSAPAGQDRRVKALRLPLHRRQVTRVLPQQKEVLVDLVVRLAPGSQRRKKRAGRELELRRKSDFGEFLELRFVGIGDRVVNCRLSRLRATKLIL